MAPLRLLAAVLLLGLAGAAFSQDKDAAKDKAEDKKDAGKLKGFLPAGYKKLGLTEKQVQAIYKIQSDYRGKKDDLTRQLAKLKDAERDEIEATLTDGQKKELKSIRAGEKDKKK